VVAAGFGGAVFVRAALGGDDGIRAAVGNPHITEFFRSLPLLAPRVVTATMGIPVSRNEWFIGFCPPSR
jgi:hypothetical protein